jgi:hypothetical protein
MGKNQPSSKKPPKIKEQTTLRICNTLAVPTLLCRRETWKLMEKEKSRVLTAEIKFLGETTKYRLFDNK